MKILWVTNIPLPEASELMNESPSPFGGWLVKSSILLSQRDDIELAIAFPSRKSNVFRKLEGSKINYYPFSKNVNNIEKDFRYIFPEVDPDIVHIFGTEMQHTLPIIKLCQLKALNVVLSIQGLVSMISKHYLSGIPVRKQFSYTIRDFIKQDNIRQQKKKFYYKGVFEIEAIKSVKHLIGRTSWDKACINQIRPDAVYHHCNEILRDSFYKHKWTIFNIEKHTIFTSQGAYPIKGLHYMIEAFAIIVKRYPDAKLYISGRDITKSNNLKNKLKKTAYAKYIEKLIGYYGLNNSIQFLGPLNEKQMCQRYLKSHVFVCPSLIENSPNSLGEAMILGVPCVASYVGGIPDMLKHKEEGLLYQHDAPYMLAHYVCEMFGNEDLALKFSKKARVHALRTHNIEVNTKRIIEIYRMISTQKANKI
jgi:glycosyltransferase involved in cell wall biosynthesis